MADRGAESPAEADDFLTQIEVPTPDYAALIAEQPTQDIGRGVSITPTAPPPPNAKAIGQLWVERLKTRDALGGIGFFGKGPDGPVVMIDTRMPRGEFDAWVAQNGWTVPKHIAFSFVDPLARPAMSRAVAQGVRYWPQAPSRTGMQNMAALYGTVYVRDGCFFVRDLSGKESLAWFLAETGLDMDADGYLILIDRRTGEAMARVGEEMVWAGPNGEPDPEQTQALRAACGQHPVANVGNPEARARMETVYPNFRRDPPPPPEV